MKITWVLPQNYDIPIGGFKIVYQYANYLTQLGNQVKIVFMKYPSYTEKSVAYKILRSIYWFLFQKNPFRNQVTWFKIDPRIEIEWNIPVNQLFFSQDEKVIATAYQTANFVNLAKIPLENKFYFIQGYETFNGPTEDVDATWKLPLNKFAVATWLVELGKNKFNENVEFVPNFLDKDDDFRIINPVEERNHTIALLNHSNKRKNTQLGLEIIREVKKQIPDLKVNLFGTEDFDASGTEYIRYFKQPSSQQLRDDIYNQSAVYLSPSETEGWGLTAMEAMASGDIVVSNDNGGVNDYIKNGVNGFIMDFKYKETVVQKIVEIMNGRDFSLAIQASQITSEFSVEKSSAKLLNILKAGK